MTGLKFGKPTERVCSPLDRLNWGTAVARDQKVNEAGLRLAHFLKDRLNGQTGKFTWSREWIAEHLCMNELKVKRGISNLTTAGYLVQRSGASTRRRCAG